MNHSNAIENNAAEQYVLGAMSDEERNAYEEHMFNCSACAEEVKCLAEFGEGVKSVFSREGADRLYQFEEKPGFWRSLWLPAPRFACAAALVFCFVGLYQTGAKYTLQADLQKARSQPVMTPQVVAKSEQFPLHEKRTVIKPFIVSLGNPFELELRVEKNKPYQATIVTTEPRIKKFSVNIPAQDDNFVRILVPGNMLQPGNYIVSLEAIDGDNKGKSEEFPFVLETKQ